MSKYLLFIFIFTLSCSRLKEPEPIAKVGNAYLYNSDIKGLIKSGLSKEDSLNMVKSIVDQWIKKQLILQRAELNLTNEEKDVSKELDEYRTSLLIYKYELKYIKENLDTTVKSDEVLNYYNLNQQNFSLNSNIAKAQYLRLHKDIKTDELKTWLYKEDDESARKIQEFCFKNSIQYEYFDDKWVSFDQIKMLFPYSLVPQDDILMTRKLYEASDSLHNYFLYVREFRKKGTIAPFDYVENDIKDIIILKRKRELINNLENNIYIDAVKKNNFTIYDYSQK